MGGGTMLLLYVLGAVVHLAVAIPTASKLLDEDDKNDPVFLFAAAGFVLATVLVWPVSLAVVVVAALLRRDARKGSCVVLSGPPDDPKVEYHP